MSKLKVKVSYLQKRRTVTYSCVLARVLLRLCSFRSSTQKKLNRFNFFAHSLAYC